MAVSLENPEQARARLRAWLSLRLGTEEKKLELSALEAPPVGQSNVTVLFEARWPEGQGEFVLRLQPAGAWQIFLSPDIAREYRVMRALEGSGVPAPRMLWLEPDPRILGGAFCVMERVHGTVPSGKPSHNLVGWLPTLSAAQRSSLWHSAMETLVTVHRVDWTRSHRFLLRDSRTAPGLAAHLDHLSTWYDWARAGRSFPVTDAALAWLKEHGKSVDEGEPVLVWGDARIGNMIVGGDLRVAAALDWEVASIGPAGVDLGYWLMMDDFHGAANGYQTLDGLPDRATSVATYERLSGRRIAKDIDYFIAMGAFFMATTLIRQCDARVASGVLAPDTTMAHGNTFTRMLARAVGIPVPEMSPDFLKHRQVPAKPAA